MREKTVSPRGVVRQEGRVSIEERKWGYASEREFLAISVTYGSRHTFFNADALK